MQMSLHSFLEKEVNASLIKAAYYRYAAFMCGNGESYGEKD